MIASDGYDSFAIMIYPVGEVKETALYSQGDLHSIKEPKSLAGFRSSDGKLYDNYFQSGYTEMMDTIDNLISETTDSRGRLFYHLTKDDNPCKRNKKCLNWYDQDVEKEGTLRLWTLYVPPCPCSLEQAENDDRYQQAEDNTLTKRCFMSVIPVKPQDVQTECCYSLLATDGGSLITLPPRAGSANRYHSVKESARHEQFDVAPYRDCCETTDLCHLYYSRRPSITCTLYRPPGWGISHSIHLIVCFVTFILPFVCMFSVGVG